MSKHLFVRNLRTYRPPERKNLRRDKSQYGVLEESVMQPPHFFVRAIKQKEWLDLGPMSEHPTQSELDMLMYLVYFALYQRYGPSKHWTRVEFYECQVGLPEDFTPRVKAMDGTPPI